MADHGNPIELLRYLRNQYDAVPSRYLDGLLTELERRARIERRRDKFCFEGFSVIHEPPVWAYGEVPSHVVTVTKDPEDQARHLGEGTGPDYWTAADAALDAAGAPKESE